VGSIGRVHEIADHVPSRVDSERACERRGRIVEGREVPMAIHGEAVEPAGRVLVDADCPTRRVDVPARGEDDPRRVEGAPFFSRSRPSIVVTCDTRAPNARRERALYSG
jgi:hypothetical protein